MGPCERRLVDNEREQITIDNWRALLLDMKSLSELLELNRVGAEARAGCVGLCAEIYRVQNQCHWCAARP